MLKNKVLNNKVLNNKVLKNKVLKNKVHVNSNKVLNNNEFSYPKRCSVHRNIPELNGSKWKNPYDILNQDSGKNYNTVLSISKDEKSDVTNCKNAMIDKEMNAMPLKSIMKSEIRTEQAPAKKVRFKKVNKIRNKGKKKVDKIKILYANANGIGDKIKSLQSAAQLYGAHVIAVTETKQIPPKMEGFGNWISKERKKRGGGGVAITARNDLYSKISEVTDIENGDLDVVWVELQKNQKEKIYIGTYYGKQETEKREEIENEYEMLNTQINMLKSKGELILTGDFNAKIKIKETNYTQMESRNGKHLQKIIDDNKLDPITIRPNIIKYTRQNRNNPEEKSIIDYVLVSEKLSPNLIETIVDQEGLYRIKGRKETDHNTILMEISLKIVQEKKKVTKWRLGNTEKWKQFNKTLQKLHHRQKTQNQEELQSTIKKAMQQTIGQITITLNASKPKESQEIKS